MQRNLSLLFGIALVALCACNSGFRIGFTQTLSPKNDSAVLAFAYKNGLKADEYRRMPLDSYLSFLRSPGAAMEYFDFYDHKGFKICQSSSESCKFKVLHDHLAGLNSGRIDTSKRLSDLIGKTYLLTPASNVGNAEYYAVYGWISKNYWYNKKFFEELAEMQKRQKNIRVIAISMDVPLSE
jgi:peptidoglycan hydrolase-like protein with peptidoglycan-binding domain